MAKLQHGSRRARYFEFLIDSGADLTLISKSDAFILGLDYAQIKSDEIKVEVANLAFIYAKKANLKIIIENQTFTVPVLISKQEVERLLGRKGIFEKFDITFREEDQEVVFRRRA